MFYNIKIGLFPVNNIISLITRVDLTPQNPKI